MSAFAIQNLLTTKEQATFDGLDKTLKARLETTLSLSPGGTNIALAREILQAIAKVEPSKERDRFFIGLLNGQKSVSEISAHLPAVNQIIVSGRFSDLLIQAGLNRRALPSQDAIIAFLAQGGAYRPALTGRVQEAIRDAGGVNAVENALYEELKGATNFLEAMQRVRGFSEEREAREEPCVTLMQKVVSTLGTKYATAFDQTECLRIVRTTSRIYARQSTLRSSCFTMIDFEEYLAKLALVKDEVGEEGIEFFFDAIDCSQEYNLDQMVRGLNLLIAVGRGAEFGTFFETWEEQDYSWESLFNLAEGQLVETGLPDRFLEEDPEAILTRLLDDPCVQVPLSAEEVDSLRERYVSFINFCRQYQNHSFSNLTNRAHTLRELALDRELKEQEVLELIAIGSISNWLHFGLFPYEVQVMLATQMLLGENRLQGQMQTGQGKSLVSALLGYVRAMSCKSHDCITSARYLAIRDQSKYEPFYRRAGISSSHICYDNKEPKHFRAQILYGPAFDFEFAFMGDWLYNKGLFDARQEEPFVKSNFDGVCVDESDNLLIDKGQSGARMGYPAEVSYDWAYAPIAVFMKEVLAITDPDENDDRANLLYAFRVLLEGSMTGAPEIVRENESEEDQIARYYIDLMRRLAANSVFPKAIALLKEELRIKISEEAQEILDNLDASKLSSWLIMAYNAITQKEEGRDYVVREQRDYRGVLHRSVNIVDIATGRVSTNSRYKGGLHEFLEVKHDIGAQKESVTPVSMHHAVFYQMYGKLMAITGTAERIQTKAIYGINSFDIPPRQPLQRVDREAVITLDLEEHYTAILDSIEEETHFGRPVLVLCETILHTEEFGRRAQERNIEFQLLNDNQAEAEEDIVERAGNPGVVTFATNTAGRGTDIILPQESLQRGGLHVAVVSFSDSEREYLQGIGRAGRQGQVGSSQRFICRKSPKIQKLLEHRGEASDEDLLSVLEQARSQKELENAQTCQEIAAMQLHLHEPTQEFFEQYRSWLSIAFSEEFLEDHGASLVSKQLRPGREYDFSDLPFKQRKLAETCVDLLKKSDTQELEWQVFLKDATQKLQSKIIYEWAVKFYEPYEGLTQKGGDEEQINAQVIEGFEAHKPEFEKYLRDDGLGVFVYLKEITGINLSGVRNL